MKPAFFSLTILLSLVGFSVLNAAAAYDIFLEIPGLPGESTDTNHKNWIDVVGFSHGISRSGGVPDHAEFAISKKLDKSSVPMNLKINQGTSHTKITVEFQTSGATKSVFYRVEMENAVITSVSSSGSAGSDFVYDSISIRYSKITWTYYPIDIDGNVGSPVTSYWDVVGDKGG